MRREDCGSAYVSSWRGRTRLFVVFLLFHVQGYAQNLAVLYPEIREPYRQIFLSIADGVAVEHSGTTYKYSLKKTDAPEILDRWLAKNHIDSVIALGTRGLKAISTLPENMPKAVVIGGVIVHPGSHQLSGISLTPSPERLFVKLLQLQPKIRRVYVIYQPGLGDWLIELAMQAAHKHGIALVAKPTNDLSELAKTYRRVISVMEPKEDALWISHDGSRLDKSILKQVLEVAWQRKLITFSSSLADMKRGALFSLYPDNFAMGNRLAAMVQVVSKKPKEPAGIVPVSELLTAVNLRTADHLGLRFSRKQKRDFGMMYPPP